MSPDTPDAVFDEFWRTAWGGEPSPLTNQRFRWMLNSVSDRRYERVLEIGCGDGTFARLLSDVSDSVVATDVSEEAIRRARERPVEGVEFGHHDAMTFPLRDEGPWDLIVMSETIPHLGWRHTFFDVAWLASEIFSSTRPGGRLLLVNTCRGLEDWLYRPWIIRAYHDLFRHVGFTPEAEHRLVGEDEVELEFLLSIFGRETNPDPGRRF
jgi:SAM-dependent methyltransferase